MTSFSSAASAITCLALLAMVASVTSCASKVEKAVAEQTKATFKGCFKDNFKSRDFTNYGGMHMNKMKLSLCQSVCKPLDTVYMAMQGDECWCGNNYGKYGAATEADCSLPCSANKADKCGNEGFNAVFEMPE